jgi:hypothetical protein
MYHPSLAGRDNAYEQIDPGIRMSGSPVMPSEPDPLLRLRVTPVGSSKRDHAVMLSRSEASRCRASQTLRCAQHDRDVHQPRHRHLRAFHLLSPLLAIQSLLIALAPTAFDELF